jgi:hypothetical protein
MRPANRFRGFNDEELRAVALALRSVRGERIRNWCTADSFEESRANVQALQREANDEIARRLRNEEADAAERGGYL